MKWFIITSLALISAGVGVYYYLLTPEAPQSNAPPFEWQRGIFNSDMVAVTADWVAQPNIFTIVDPEAAVSFQTAVVSEDISQ